MTGEWLPPLPPPHHCELPTIPYERGVGERWRCECGAIFVIVEASQRNETWKQWSYESGPRPNGGRT